MPDLYLTNSFSNIKEKFIPLQADQVGMYVCGPTVYDRPHLGNVRSAVIYDILYRLLKRLYNKILYVRNITDIDDKIIKVAQTSGEEISSLTQRMSGYYHEDLKAVGCLSPDIEPKATEHLREMFLLIEELIKQGHAYIAQGHILFAIETWSEYGKISGRNIDEMIAGARIEVAPYKKHPADFVLWKPLIEKQDSQFGLINKPGIAFESPWGWGRPGWHIECSAMSNRYLGKNFDIHGGGIDLIFPHHENEVAQSKCAAKGSTFARYWVHNGFLTVHNEKMSKSLGNFYTVRELLDKGVPGVVLRYFYITTHYRKPLDYNDKAIDDSYKALAKFAKVCNFDSTVPKVIDTGLAPLEPHLLEQAISILCNDLNTPALLAYMHELAADNRGKELQACCDFLGFNLSELQLSSNYTKMEQIPEEIIILANKRQEARSAKNWIKADEIKQIIRENGYHIRDEPKGYILEKLK